MTSGRIIYVPPPDSLVRSLIPGTGIAVVFEAVRLPATSATEAPRARFARPLRRPVDDIVVISRRRCPRRSRGRLLLAVVTLNAISLIGGGCSSPGTSSPSPVAPSTLVIAGATDLTLGLTSQLTAQTTAGMAVPSGVTWQSAAPSIATVSATGLLTAVGLGTTTVTATTLTATGHATIIVASGNAVTTISSCGLVTLPGHYSLSTDLTGAPFGGCVQISSVAGLQFDCRGHAVTTIVIDHVNAAAIQNCKLTGLLKLSSVLAVTVTSCSFSNAGIDVSESTGVNIVGNTLALADKSGLTAAIRLQGGTNNRVTETTLTGGYDGGVSQIGTDDGIVLTNETGDDIESNTITDFYDAGVETTDTVANTTIAKNAITTVGLAGIGSYWCTSWTSNVVSANNVSMAVALVYFLYNTGPDCGATPSSAAFWGNQFIGNVFRSPIQGPQMPAGAAPRMRAIVAGPVTGNLVENNDLGSNDGPEFLPLSGFIDGGGNICGPLNAAISNFPCTGGGTIRARRSVPPRSRPNEEDQDLSPFATPRRF